MKSGKITMYELKAAYLDSDLAERGIDFETAESLPEHAALLYARVYSLRKAIQRRLEGARDRGLARMTITPI